MLVDDVSAVADAVLEGIVGLLLLRMVVTAAHSLVDVTIGIKISSMEQIDDQMRTTTRRSEELVRHESTHLLCEGVHC